MNWIRRAWRYLTTPVKLEAKADCEDCYGLGFDASGRGCFCVREVTR